MLEGLPPEASDSEIVDFVFTEQLDIFRHSWAVFTGSWIPWRIRLSLSQTHVKSEQFGAVGVGGGAAESLPEREFQSPDLL